MKKQLLFVFFFFSLTLDLCAQDAIYTANGNRLDNAQLADLTEDRVIFTVQKADKPSTYNFQRQNVLVAFRKGNFLIVKDLNADLGRAKQELQTFLTTTAWQDKDYLIRAVPFAVIPAKISYESDVLINYVTNEGKSASISKGELIAVLYRDGRHNLIRDASEVAPLLAELKKPIEASLQPVLNQPVAKAPTPSARKPVETVSGTKPSQSAEVQSSEKSPQPNEIASSPQLNKLILSEADYQSYRQKALDKVDEFSSYLNVITNKSLSAYERNQAVDQAASLFMPAATIEVTSNKRPGARRYPIRTYLNNLKLLPYSSTKIEWTEVQYLKELSQAADGNYYGIITGQQTFIGYGAGNTQYSDITPKNVRVKLERYHLTRNGQDDVKWNLLLGSIGVSAQ